MAAAAAPHSERKRQALELFSGLPARYDLLSALLSFGQDPRWRRALVRGLGPARLGRVLDVATGTGLVAAELVRQGAREVVALDQSDAMLSVAERRFAERAGGDIEASLGAAGPRGDGRVVLLRGEAETLPFEDRSFDGLTFTYLLRYVDDPAAVMRELARVMRPGGRVASLEFGVPPAPLARAAWRVYTGVGLPLCGRLVSRSWGEVGRFLGPSIAGFYERHPLDRIAGYWRDAGLRDVQVRRMSLGGGVLMFAERDGRDAQVARVAGGA
ncbi:MAG TPA: class I SAM-dependent methyltransferase [Solirubrobacteraceae bacterium]|jgi:demethylmenaquinone methyltransferase/2-methoxy-6-polyprenyl-1,4-benzoquinol methylase|nr:class I SAM-dependent methyltransferase [Solirubrobacteraceae bacterium]